MRARGKVHLLRDPEGQRMAEPFKARVAAIRRDASNFCCGGDRACAGAMARVAIGYCQSAARPGEPDPCVFGGTYRMAGAAYPAMFAELARPDGETSRSFPFAGDIRLTTYAPLDGGVATLEPTLRHELGHACSMIKMQLAANDRAGEREGQRERATKWLEGVKNRCDVNAELSDAYADFWESVGESRELAGCFMKLAKANRDGRVDRPCSHLCPGHYLEEAAGVAFSLLTGDLDGGPSASFPNTCDHVRDGQHPMVGDVVDCLAQHSPRFRARLAAGQRCG